MLTSFALICAAGLALGGCSGSPLLEKDTYSHLFSKKINLFAKPEWADATVSANNVHLNPKGPVPARDLVSADGRCAPPLAAAPASAPPAAGQAKEPAPATTAAAEANRPVGSVAGDLAGAPMRAAPRRHMAATTGSAPPPDQLVPEGSGGSAPSSAALLGGIALDMTECQVVRRAGTPNNVTISGGKGVRKVVLSYLGGNWPGIYHFRAGRLKEIDATPEQARADAKSNARKRARRRAARESARRGTERFYVQ